MKLSAPLWLEVVGLSDWKYFWSGWRNVPLQLLWVHWIWLELSGNTFGLKLLGLGFRINWWWSNEYPW